MYGTAFCPLSQLEEVKQLGVAGEALAVAGYSQGY